MVESGDARRDHEADGTADLGEVTQFGGAVTGQAQHQDRPGAKQTECGHGEFARVGQLDQDAVARG